jgi:hypothetical protein
VVSTVIHARLCDLLTGRTGTFEIETLDAGHLERNSSCRRNRAFEHLSTKESHER